MLRWECMTGLVILLLVAAKAETSLTTGWHLLVMKSEF